MFKPFVFPSGPDINLNGSSVALVDESGARNIIMTTFAEQFALRS